jgi:hypothetical protein
MYRRATILPASQLTGLRKIKIREKFLRRILSPAIDSGERQKRLAAGGADPFQDYCLNKDLR